MSARNQARVSGTHRAAPLRIALLDSWYRASHRGSGTTVAIATLAQALAASGHDVATFSPAPGRMPHLLSRLLFNRQIRREASIPDHDIVIGIDIDGTFLPGGHPPKVVCLKGVAADEARFERGRARALLSFLARLEARNARSADLVVVPSEYSARVAKSVYRIAADSVAVVPEGIDLRPWERLRTTPPPRTDERPTVLTVARAYPRKDLRTLIDAMPLVLRSIPTAQLRIVGEGPETRRLRAQVWRMGLAGSVTFLGAPEAHAAVRAEYARADVFCLPSRQEGFGIVLLEAMAAGVPIVAACAGAVPEVVRPDREALLVPAGDVAAVATAIVRLLSDAELRRTLADAGLRRVRAFEATKVARQFVDLILPLARRRLGRRPRSATPGSAALGSAVSG